ncbi:MAG: DUF58 domain-containing protein [Desulfuromonadales bacterium]|nr:DUF58 domain-containing protein [Desulfuromonadales bacterium]MBN2793093.1 DUF58 domain-containing protein [Desulfuromonadales bacterium]
MLLGFAAVNTGNNLLYLMVSAFFGFMAVSGLVGQQNLRKLSLRVLAADDLFAQLPGRVEVELTNQRRWLPAFLINLTSGDASALVAVLAPGQSCRRFLPVVMPERGYQQLSAIQIYSCFPINFFVRSRLMPGKRRLLVFPRPISSALPGGQYQDQPARQLELSQPGIDGELRSIDSYRQSDPLKSIHWKLSARHDDFRVKRQNQLGAPSLLLNLDEFSGSLEERLGMCAYLVSRLIAQQRAVGLKLDHQIIDPASGRQQRLKLLTELALYGRR